MNRAKVASIGLSRLPTVAVIVAIAAQAFIAAQLAWHSGRRSPNAGASAPNDSPASPDPLGIYLIAEQLTR